MKILNDFQEIKVLEIITIIASLTGIILTLFHGNLYDYFFDVFTIKSIWNFHLLYVSLLVYSCLALVVFASLFFLDEKNPKIRFRNYLQGWLLIILAAASYEWFVNIMMWGSQIVLQKQTLEDPYNFFTKRANVIFFGALFIFWLLEKNKNQIKNSRPY